MKIIFRGDDILRVVDTFLNPELVLPIFQYGKRLSVELEFYHENGIAYTEAELNKYEKFKFGMDTDFDFITPAAALTIAGFTISGNKISFSLWTASARFKQLLGTNDTISASAAFNSYLTGETLPSLTIIFPVTFKNAILSDAESQAPPQFQFSVDGENDWHNDQVDADLYCHFNVNDGSVWSDKIKMPLGPAGAAFVYEDFTPEQLITLMGADFTYDDFTPEQLALLKGAAFVYEDFTPEQLIALMGADFTYDDFTPEQLSLLKGDNAPQAHFQFSINGETDWHTLFATGDLYLRISVDGGNAWFAAIKFIGENAGDLPVTELGTSGVQTINRSVSDKFIIPEPTGAIILADSSFADMKQAIIDINNGGTHISYPALWEWTNGVTPEFVNDGVDRLKLRKFSYGETSKIFASLENLFIRNPYPLNSAGLEGWWAYENSGDVDSPDIWEDASDNTNNGTLIADAFVDSNGLNVDGSGDHVDCGNDSSLILQTGTDPYTMSCRFKTTQDPSSNVGLVVQRNDDSPYQQLGITLNKDDGVITVIAGDVTNGHTNLSSSSTGYNNDEWHQAVVVYDSTTLYLYMDGLLSNSVVKGTSLENSRPLKIGTKEGYDFSGEIDDTQVYSRALGAAEILTNFLARRQE